MSENDFSKELGTEALTQSLTFRGYIISTICVICSFSLTALQFEQTIQFFASIPRSWVIGAGAGELRSKTDERGRRTGLRGKLLPSAMRWSTRNLWNNWIMCA